MGPVAGCTWFIVGCSAGLCANLIFGSESKLEQQYVNLEQQYMREQRRANEAENLLAWAARFGCDKHEDYHDLVADGWTFRQLVKLDVERRHEKDKADMELRFKEGTPTLQDVKWRQRLQDQRRHEEEAARRAKALEERKQQETRDRQMWDERYHREEVQAQLAGIQELLRKNLNVWKQQGS